MLELKDVTYSYQNKSEAILSKVELSVSRKVNFIVLLGNLERENRPYFHFWQVLIIPRKGQVLFNGENIKKKGSSYHRRHHVALVFQNYNLIDYLTPLENVRLVNKNADKKILSELGLDEKQINRNVLQLSGGQQQRVAIARALVSEAPIILADEPTGNLDEETAKDIIAILKRMALDRQKCVIVVTHSKEVAQASDVVLELKKKQLIEKKK